MKKQIILTLSVLMMSMMGTYTYARSDYSQERISLTFDQKLLADRVINFVNAKYTPEQSNQLLDKLEYAIAGSQGSSYKDTYIYIHRELTKKYSNNYVNDINQLFNEVQKIFNSAYTYITPTVQSNNTGNITPPTPQPPTPITTTVTANASDYDKFENILNQYCRNKTTSQVTIADPQNMTRSQVLTLGEQLYQNKNIEGLGLLYKWLIHGGANSHKGREINGLTTQEYLNIGKYQQALGDQQMNDFGSILDSSDSVIIEKLLKQGYSSQLIGSAMVSLYVSSSRGTEKQRQEILDCGRKIYYEPFILYESARYYDKVGQYSKAYTFLQMADRLEDIKPKNLDNKYKVGELGKIYSELYKKYIYHENLGISSDTAKAAKTLAEQYMRDKYPQYIYFVHGKPLYTK